MQAAQLFAEGVAPVQVAAWSPACREGSSTAGRNREYVAVIVSTGSTADW